MKNIDIKSLIIGALLTSTIFFGVAAASLGPRTSDVISGNHRPSQVWRVRHTDQIALHINEKERVRRDALNRGWEPFAANDRKVFWRQRTK